MEQVLKLAKKPKNKKSTVFNKKPKKAVVPVTDKIRRLLDKYDFVFPVPSDTLMRKMIKTIAIYSGLNTPFKYVEYSGMSSKNIVVPMYERITIHTARRSAARRKVNPQVGWRSSGAKAI